MESEGNKEDRGNATDGLFENLKMMSLAYLPNLRSIYKMVLPFPELQCMMIYECDNLKKLPLDFNSAKSLNKIEGDPEWWENLEWEDPIVKDLLHSKFHQKLPLDS